MKNKKKFAAVLALTMGVTAFSAIEAAPPAEAASLQSTYNSYVKQVTTLSNQVSKVRSRSQAWNLIYKMEMLDDKIGYLEDQAEWSGNWTLARQCDRLDDRLGLAKDRLEYRWGIDD